MKKINIIPKFFSLVLLMSMALVSCDVENDAFTIGINDFNDRITSVDKEIAAPGDTVIMTGTNLDQVYKIMLNNDNVPVKYVATPTQLKIAIPGSAPLGDVVTVNIFFSGKGLAQRAIAIQSPPTILKVTPSAAQPGTTIKVLGKELYKAVKVYVGDVEVPFTVVDDKNLTLVLPVGFTGGAVKLVSATGSETLSQAIVLGTEIILNDFDGTAQYFKGSSNNGNIDAKVEVTGDFPNLKYWTLPIANKASSWGGNFDLYLLDAGVPVYTREQVTLAIDIKASKAMNVSIMVEDKTAAVYGLTKGITAEWQTIAIPFVDMGSGYGNNGTDPVPDFNMLKGVKIQPPAGSSSGNFGESVSIDNVRFIIAN